MTRVGGMTWHLRAVGFCFGLTFSLGYQKLYPGIYHVLSDVVMTGDEEQLVERSEVGEVVGAVAL